MGRGSRSKLSIPFLFWLLYWAVVPASAQVLLFGDLGSVLRDARQPAASLPQAELIPRATLFYSDSFGSFRVLGELVGQLERSHVGRVKAGWSFGPEATFWLGRFHSPASLWRARYHHASYLEPTIARPGIAEFEVPVGILQGHVTGAQFEGEWSFGNHALAYMLTVGYGGKLEEEGLEMPPILDLDTGSHNTATAGRLIWAAGGSGIELGVFFSFNHIDNHRDAPAEYEQVLTGGLLEWGLGRLDLSAELYRVRNRPRPGGGASWDDFVNGYLQGVYHLNGRWSLNARIEDGYGYKEDSYLRHFPSFVTRRRLVGGRYDIAPRQSLKAELRLERLQSGERYHALALQWSLVLP